MSDEEFLRRSSDETMIALGNNKYDKIWENL